MHEINSHEYHRMYTGFLLHFLNLPAHMLSPTILSQDNTPIDLMNPVKEVSLDLQDVSDTSEKYLIMNVQQTSGTKPDGTWRSII